MIANKCMESEAEIYKRILNAIRVRILKSLAVQPKTAFELSKELGLHASTIYRNLDVLGTYGLVQVFKLEPYKHIVKKYYMPTFKAYYVAFDQLKDVSYNFFATLDRYIGSRWKVKIVEKYVDAYAKIALDPKLIEAEHKLLIKFLEEMPYTLEDLNDPLTFMIFSVYALKNITDEKLRELEYKKIEILSRFVKGNPASYDQLRRRLISRIESCQAFLNLLEKCVTKIDSVEKE